MIIEFQKKALNLFFGLSAEVIFLLFPTIGTLACFFSLLDGDIGNITSLEKALLLVISILIFILVVMVGLWVITKTQYIGIHPRDEIIEGEGLYLVKRIK